LGGAADQLVSVAIEPGEEGDPLVMVLSPDRLAGLLH
jgi:hypothetical protein